jgi:hypothetical protein
MTALFSKIALPLLILVAGMVAGIGVQQKILDKKSEGVDYGRIDQMIFAQIARIPKPEAVSVQPFDVEKIKNLKSFSYAPQFTGSVSVAGVDSTSIRKYIDQAVMRAFDLHIKSILPEPEKKKRR